MDGIHQIELSRLMDVQANGGFVPRANVPVPPLTANTDGATVTFDLSVSDFHTVTLAGDRTLALANPTGSRRFYIALVQDATGSRLVSQWFTTIKWAGGSAPTLTTTANKADVLEFIQTGSGTYYGKVWGANL